MVVVVVVEVSADGKKKYRFDKAQNNANIIILARH